MRRRWAVRVAVSVATGAVATALLLSLETTLAPAGTTASLTGAGTAGIVVALALLPATARYPRGVLRRARRIAVGTLLGVGIVGFAGYAGAGVLPGPLALLATGGALVLVLPVAYERGWGAIAEPRTLVAGDDPTTVRRAAATIDPPAVGFCAPPTPRSIREGTSVSARSDRAAVAPGSGSAPDTSPEPTAQLDGAADRRSKRGPVQQPDDGSVGLTPRDSSRGQPGRRPTTSESGRLSASADAAVSADTASPADAAASADAVASADAATSVGAASHAGSDRESGPSDPERLGGLSALDRVVRDRGVDAVVLRFATPDREGFFGALRTCHAAGVEAFVTRSRTEPVVLAGEHRSLEAVERESANRDQAARRDRATGSALAPVALEVLPWHGRLVKRGFDLAFATVGIAVLSPLMTAIAVVIRLDSPGPVLYGQRRTGRLGEPFQLLKFRSMVSDAEVASGPRLSDEDAGGVDPRVTRVGRVLRATHLDELPQLFSILVGEMSVVGPRPERPTLDAEIAADGVAWRQRWFLKPGLTGLAQINDVTGFQPREKLAYDLEYARRQSLALDVRIVAIQLGRVAGDVLELLARRLR